MIFILQKEKEFDLDILIIKKLIEENKYIHSYIEMKLDDFYEIKENKKQVKSANDFPKDFFNYIPMGTIDFVNSYFKIFYNTQMNALEIPNILKTDEFLKRKYSIVKAYNIPKKGEYFIKDATQLKSFSYTGELSYLLYDGIFDESKKRFDTSLHLNPNHLYQVSEIVNVLSEYRIFIVDEQIYSITHYNGDPTIFPDINLIKKANSLYMTQKDYPKSYDMDVMITPKGTAIIEIHPVLFSTGLYHNLHGSKFLYAFQDGKNYILNHNTKSSEFSNF